MTSRRKYQYSILLLIVAAAEFLYRGPVRTLRYGDFTDLSVPYVASRLWLNRANPYDPANFMSTWTHAGGMRFVTRNSPTNLRPAYPPSTLPVLCVFAVLPWIAARDLFTLATIVLFWFLLKALLDREDLRLNTSTGILCCAFAVGLAPWHGAVALQNLTALTVELAVLGTCADSAIWGGMLLGLALCLKPQLTAWFVLSDLVQKRWRRTCWSVGLFAVIATVALLRLPHGWLDMYHQNLRYFFAVGDVNDFTTRNSSRFELLNLQVVFYYITRMYKLSNVLSGLVTVGLLGWWFLRARGRSELVNLSAVVLIGLLPVYQRVYSAGLVIVILPYVFARWEEAKARLILALSSVFLIPGAAVLQTLYNDKWINPVAWAHNWLLNLFVGPHSTWVLLAIIVILLLWRAEPGKQVSPVLGES